MIAGSTTQRPETAKLAQQLADAAKKHAQASERVFAYQRLPMYGTSPRESTRNGALLTLAITARDAALNDYQDVVGRIPERDLADVLDEAGNIVSNETK